MKMDSHLSGSKEEILLAIEGEEFNLYIKGKRPETAKVSEDDLAYYRVKSLNPINISIAGIYEEELKELRLKSIPLFFEQTAYEIIIEVVGDSAITLDHDSHLIRNRVTPLGKSGKMQSGVINFGSEIGLSEFRVLADGKEILKFIIEVYPTKLSYKADYLKLQEDITNEIYNLAYDFMKQAYRSAGLKNKKETSLTEFFSIYKMKFSELRQAIKLINYRPHHQLVEEVEVKNYREGMNIGRRGVNYLNKHPNELIIHGQTHSAKKVLVTNKVHTEDIYENRVIKFMLEQIIGRLKSIKATYSKLRRNKDNKLQEFIDSQILYLEQQLRSPLFRTINKLDRPMQFSLVMHMSPVYRKFYKIYLELQRSLSLSEDIFSISQKNVAELYEYWCFIKLGALLKKHHPLKGNNIICLNSKGLYVSLKKGKESTLTFTNSKTGELFSLSYNRGFNSNPTVSQKPDNMLILKKEMSTVTYHYVLDAKYKIDYNTVDDFIAQVPHKEDINTLHRYRDAIVWDDSRKGIDRGYEKVVFGGVILFPGNEEVGYMNHDFYKSIEKVNIGGLPFLPSHTDLVEDFLKDLVSGSGKRQYKNTPNTIGSKSYLKELDIKTKNVLIGPVKSKQQLDRSLEHNMYHIPQKALKALNKQIETIVLYEPKTVNGVLKDGGIRYEGKVKSAKAIQRKQIDEYFPLTSNNGEEIYILYEIYSWKERKEILRPSKNAPVRGPRYTNEVLLKYAKTLPELYIKEEVEFNLILELRRNTYNLETGMSRDEKLELTLGNTTVSINEDLNIVITKQNGETKIFDKEILENHPRQIYNEINLPS